MFRRPGEEAFAMAQDGTRQFARERGFGDDYASLARSTQYACISRQSSSCGRSGRACSASVGRGGRGAGAEHRHGALSGTDAGENYQCSLVTGVGWTR